MHLKRLTIHNIASIEDAVIDFEASPLAEAEVFLITGRTGAGKSTILDAICLALYADTPRLDNTNMQGAVADGPLGREIKLNDPRIMLRRNTGEGFAELDFTGTDGVEYTARWSAGRARNKPDGNLKLKSWQLTRHDNGDIYTKDADIKAAISEAIGLDFRQFCRTTMLAQGDFTRFLNSPDEEKAAILEKITGTEVYSLIGQKVFEMTRERQNAYDAQRRKAETISLLSLEEREGIVAQSEQYVKEGALMSAKRAALLKCIEWFKTIHDIGHRIEHARKVHAEAVARRNSPEYEALESLQTDLEATAEPRTWLKQLAAEQKDAERQQHVLDNDLYDNFARLLGSLTVHERHVGGMMRQAEQYNDICRQIKEIEKEVEGLNLAELRSKKERILLRRADLGAAKRVVETVMAEQKRHDATRSDIEQMTARLAETTEMEKQSSLLLTEATRNRDAAREMHHRQRMAVDNAAVAMRSSLRQGDTCPVCGQAITDSLPQEEAIRSLFNTSARHLRQVEERYDKLAADVAAAQATITGLKKSISDSRLMLRSDNSLEKSRREMIRLCDICGADPSDPDLADHLKELEAEQTKLLAELTIRLDEGEEKDKKLRAYRTHAERLRRVAEEAEKSQAALADERDAFAAIVELVPAWKDAMPSGSRQSDGLLGRVNTFAAKVRAAIEIAEKMQQAVAATRKRIEDFVASDPRLSMSRLQYLDSLSPDDIKAAKEKLEAWRDDVVASESALKQLDRQMEDMRGAVPPGIDDSTTLETLEEEIGNLDENIGNIGRNIGALNQRLADDDQKRAALSAMQQATAALQMEWERWQRLNAMIGDATGNKFRRIAQSYVLDSLIHCANSYMRILSDRYTLEVTPGTFIISIVDSWQGYTRRVASTLSGGESFLVSLALALALSDIGSRLSVDTLFIDEGFGTLSGEALHMAVETMRSLHTRSGRHVGIISHVTELRDCIDVQLKVSQRPGSSSSIVEIVG